MTYEDALEQALRLANDEQALNAFLAGQPEWEADLRRALATSRVLRAESAAILPPAAAASRVESRLLEAVAARAQKAPGWRQRLFAIWAAVLHPRPLIAAGTIGVALAVVSLVLLPMLRDDTEVANAVTIRGDVSEVGSSLFIISENGTEAAVKIGANTSLTDGVGNAVDASVLSPGQSVVLRGTQVGDEVLAESVEIESYIFGNVTALTQSSITVTNSTGVYEIRLTPDTRIEGPIAVGAYVEVEVMRDGGFVALEVEVEDGHGEEEEESERGDDDIAAPSTGTPSFQNGGSSPANTPGLVPTPTAEPHEDDGGDETPEPTEDSHESGGSNQQAEPTEAPEPTEKPEATQKPEPTEDHEDDH